MNLPSQIQLSSAATDKFRMLKQRTGVTPNILSRMAIMLAIESKTKVSNAGLADTAGQVISREVMFGEHALAYECLIREYVKANEPEISFKELIPLLIEIGAHKMGHAKTIGDLTKLKAAA